MDSKVFAISPIGISLFLIAILSGALWNRHRFIGWTFFFAPLFDLPVMWIRGTRVTPFHAIILGWSIASLLRNRKISRFFRFTRPEIALLSWLAIVWLSLLMPIIFSGTVDVVTIHTPWLDYNDKVPLRFTLTNITQSIYPTFMVWAVLVTSRAFSSESDIIWAINNLLRGVTFVFLSGLLMQVGIFFSGAHFVHLIAQPIWGIDRTHEVMARVANYDAFGNFPRMYTLAGEPGFTANLFATAFALVSTIMLTTYDAYSLKCLHRPSTLTMLSMLVFGLCVAGSTTGYLGFFLVFSLIIMVVVLPRLIHLKLPPRFSTFIIITITVVLALLVMAYLAGFNPLRYLLSKQVGKITELHGSGATRMKTVIYSLKLFFELPVLGVGYGSHRSGALITALLSNIGTVGTLAFFTSMCFYIIECTRTVQHAVTNYRASIAQATCIALILWLCLSAVSVSIIAFLFPWFWLLLALIHACGNVPENTAPHQSLLIQP